ncbi:MAG: protein-disulfide reductase DsbD domain-containing protein [Ferruginibacter sp.]|nr:sugar transporter [Ferruginibacter sp.]
MKKITLALFVLLFSVSVHAQITSPVKWNYTAKKIAVGIYELHITATIEPKWHIYSQDAGEGPVPTSIAIDKNPLITLDGKITELGKLQKEYSKVFSSTLKFYSNKVDFVQKIKLKTTVNTIAKGKVTFMVCNDEKCLAPSTIPFSIKINAK